VGKNIVVLSDGTGKEGGVGNNSNVYKLFNIIEDRTKEQIVYYDPGLGTRDAGVLGLMSGYGISGNIKDCYRFIFENYEAGDDIYLIGFSRGAATVRSLSSFIHYFGILPESRPELIDRAYRIYQTKDPNERKARADAFIERHHTMWSTVHFLGCFDTVSALGVPFRNIDAVLNQIPYFQHEFHNFRLSPSVENAYHALAIDDKRETFHPKLWDPESEDYQSIRQVWFAGMHTDVGGGYEEDDLSDVSMKWMWRQAKDCGLRIYDPSRIDLEPKPAGKMHDSRGDGWHQLYRKERRSWPVGRDEQPIVHQSVIQRAEERENYDPWILDHDYEVEPSCSVDAETV
jgi:uncharacterized protein (DUF2235 family)